MDRDYDAFGRLHKLWYPETQVPGASRFVITYGYTPTGYAESVWNVSHPGVTELVWQIQSRTADGNLQESEWGGPIGIPGQWPALSETRTYDTNLGRLESIATHADEKVLFHLHYQYDRNGNVTSRGDLVAGRGETYEYDPLERLTTWRLQTNTQNRVTAYSYDNIGNLTSISENGGAPLVHTYGAQVPGAPKLKPHALTAIQVPGAPPYEYDPRGRQTSGGGRHIAWTEFDLPKEVTQNGDLTTFDYDAFGTRIRKSLVPGGAGDPTASTITLGSLYERRQDLSKGTLQHVFYVHGEDGPVAQIVVDPNAATTVRQNLQRDGLSTVALVFDIGGKEVERLFFEPFGDRIDPDGNPFAATASTVLLGFTGHRHDQELGLIDMKGRLYDPFQKHFLTPDPTVSSPLFSQDLNRYAYVWNNPVSITDPSGLQEEPPRPQPPQPGLTLGADIDFGPLLRLIFGGDPPEKKKEDPKGPTPTKPAQPTSDQQGASPATGPVSQPTPQELPPPDEKPKDEEFGPYDPEAHRQFGLFVGTGVGMIPYGAPIFNFMILNGILPKGTPEAREGLMRGQLIGGIFSLRNSLRTPPPVTPLVLPRPLPVTPQGGTALAPPLVVVNTGVGVVAASGLVVNIALAANGIGLALSQGGSGGADEEGDKSKTIRNGHLAGKTHPKTGVPFDSNGFPDFKAAGLVKAEVKITPTGSRPGDFRAANAAAKFEKTPEGYTWHHHQDGTTMQLVPKNVHGDTGHTGGFSLGTGSEP